MGSDSELSQIQRYGSKDWGGCCFSVTTHYIESSLTDIVESLEVLSVVMENYRLRFLAS